LYEHLLATEVSLADVYAIADAITDKYKADGYVLSRAFVPAQPVPFGSVRIQVIEGYVDRIVMRGEVKGLRSLIQAYAEKITALRPLQVADLERYILLMNDLPGVTARTALNPSPESPEAYDLIITLEHAFVDGFAHTDNHGSRFVGPVQVLAGVGLNSVLGLYEKTSIRYATARPMSELRFVDIEHQENLGSDGTRLILSGSDTFSEPGFTLRDDDVDSRSRRATVALTRPIVRRRNHTVLLNGEATWRNSRSTEQGVPSRDDRLRVLRLGGTYFFRADWGGGNRLTVTASQGVNVLNASTPGSPNLSRSDGKSNFTKIAASILRLQQLSQSWALLFTAQAQKSADPLLSAEEFLLGGKAFGRAFSPAELAGDDGGAFSIKAQYTGEPGLDFLKNYQLYIYYDKGAVWNFNSGSDPAHRTLASLGAGASINILDHLSAYFEVAKPLLRGVLERGTKARDTRFFFGVTGHF